MKIDQPYRDLRSQWEDPKKDLESNLISRLWEIPDFRDKSKGSMIDTSVILHTIEYLEEVRKNKNS